MAILLIRHGETDANAQRIVQRPDVPLSTRGVEQARRLATRLAGRRPERILSSDLRRAVVTAEVLRDALGAPLTLDAALRERDYGDVRGTPYADLGVDILAPDYAPPNGETWDQFHARVDEAWRTILSLAARTAGDLAIVTHGLVCHAIATRHLDLAPHAIAAVGWGNTSLTIIPAPDYRTADPLACTAHLTVPTAGGPA